MKRNLLSSSNKTNNITNNRLVANRTAQRGAAVLVGVVLITLLLIGAVVFAYAALTSKQSATLQADPVQVKADDFLTQGKSNGELAIDRKIIKAGIDRDDEQRKTADKALSDEALPVGDGVTTATTVEAERLSNLQTEFTSEADRRLKELDATLKLSDKLEPSQKADIQKRINDEVTALTGLKAKAAAETAKDGFLADRDALEKQYLNYLLANSQAKLVMWANYQSKLDEKVNVFGGKFQERLNDASAKGNGISTAQTALNSYQSNKTQAKTATAQALKSVLAVKPGTYESNRAVLKTYYTQLSGAHNNVVNAYETSAQLLQAVTSYK